MRIRNGFVLREVAGQYVVIATGEATEHFHGMIRLNETGKDIWQALAHGCSEGEIAERITEIYSVDIEKAAADVRAMLEQMEQAGFLTS